MVDDPFSVKSVWNVSPPCYVRKVDKPRHWPGDGKPKQERIDEIARSVFGLTPAQDLSVFWIRNSRDLRRVIVGLAARGKRGHCENTRLVAIVPAELGDIRATASQGKTWCEAANRLHRDLAVPDSRSLRRMIERMLLAEREPEAFRKNKIKRAVAESKEEGCYAADPGSTHCNCVEETRHRITWWGILIVIGLLAASVAIFAPKLAF